ncbi:hypothetical protein J2T02_004798 [Chitinophaga terrae (ex Kim and Jung 2007)]|uniref:hypothetical protein n=1 Tax=Chitinophaga terrae (ex Kim and Jung 2007) TaxID=408074 RepID=UPI0027870787|nr:hypothetical protein [Chitinophaga terrae (ex Kim and Jung 2007)]MDQ0109654.1 hypothetical protein [Chitinophaga terrae (ex Kim and Jung 2007)]
MRFLILLFTGVFLANIGIAQKAEPSVNEITFRMLTYMKNLKADVDKGLSAEKKAAMNEQLAQLKTDLAAYMKTRKTYSDSLMRHNIAPGNKNPDNLEVLKGKMSQVMQQLRGVNDLVSPALQAEGDKLNDEMYNVLYGEPVRYLSNLEAFLAGVPVTKKDLAIDASVHYQRLEECLNIITAIQNKIR